MSGIAEWSDGSRHDDAGGTGRSNEESLATHKLQALNQLIAGVAHELNNPLTSVQGLAALLLSDAPDDESRQDLQIVVSEANRAIQIIRNLRAFAGRADESAQPCSLTGLMAQVVDVRGYETRARGIELSLALDEDLPTMLAVPTEVLHLGLMLLLRAERALLHQEAADRGASRITIVTGATDGTLSLRVEDNGVHPEDSSDDPALAACAAAAARIRGVLREERGADGGSIVTVELPADL